MSDSIEQQNSSLDRLNRWFELATLAPSGANLQPWSYSGKPIGNGFKITLGLERDYLNSPSSIDPLFIAVAISLGAFARNLEIAALLDGFHCSNIEQLGERASEWRWIFEFRPSLGSAMDAQHLKTSIRKRVSNRNPYSRTPMATSDWEMTCKILGKNPDFTLTRSPIRHRYIWIKILSILEKIRCHDDRLRTELFKEFRTQEELRRDPIGLPMETVTASTTQRWFLLQLKKWPKLQFILKCGAEYFFIRSSIRKPLIHAGEVLILQSHNPDARFGFEMGKLLEELWLRWTERGYSLQILALPLLIHGAQSDDFTSRLSTHNQDMLKKASRIAKDKLAMNLNLPTLVIRIGKAKIESPQSPRRNNFQEKSQ